MSRYSSTEMVPAKPFADLLNARVEYWEKRLGDNWGYPGADGGPTVRVAREFGWTDGDSGTRRLHRIRHRILESSKGKGRHSKGIRVITVAEEFRRDLVEDALHYAGISFGDLYPDIAAAEELELEPEKWCCGCQAPVTPIGGYCPWCNWRVGPTTGQKLRGRHIPKDQRELAA